MLPDISIKDYYLQFIYKARADAIDYKNIIESNKEVLNEIIKFITDNKQFIEDTFNIYLDSYKDEWIANKYNPKEMLYKRIIKVNDLITDTKSKTVAIQIIKFCSLLKNIDKYNKLIILADKRKELTFKQYRTIVNKYYVQVHKCLLEGYGYKFNYGIGTYCINYWKLFKDRKNKKKIIDFAATNARKKELLAKGVKIYDDKEAAWYNARHIPYDGVDYRVYREDAYFYEFTFIDSEIFRYEPFEYKRTEYVVNKYRGMSYTEMADSFCKTFDDICNLQVDIKYKLNILLYKDPTKYINFIRNAEQIKYKC